MLYRTMRRLVPVLAMAAIVLSSTVLDDAASAAAEGPLVRVIVGFDAPPGQAGADQIISRGGTVRRIYTRAPAISAFVPASAVNDLRSAPGVAYVADDFQVRVLADTVPWGVDRVAGSLVGGPNRGQGVKVAILDSGIDLDHPDLTVAGNVTFVDGTTSGDDDHGHGTSVAGVVAALDNGVGIVGVAPGAQLYAVKVVRIDGGAFISDIDAGLEWSINNGMQVINMSFGAINPFPTSSTTLLKQAFEQGIVLVGAAGNGGQGEMVFSPAREPGVIAVGATDQQNLRLPESSSGSTLELMAPGANILTTAMGGGQTTSTAVSWAAPHVAGTAALYLAAGLTSGFDVQTRMQERAIDLGPAGRDNDYGFGLVNPNGDPFFQGGLTPSVSVSFSGTPVPGGQWLKQATVTLAQAPGWTGPPITSIRYTVNGGNVWQTYTGPFTVAADGANVVMASGRDATGAAPGLPASAVARVTSTPAFTANKDSFMRSSLSNLNEGANERLLVTKSVRALPAFDLTNIPTEGLTRATLYLTIAANGDNWQQGSGTIDARQVLVDWTEGNGRNLVLTGGGASFRGTGAGVTWACRTDTDISNNQTDCDPAWVGGTILPPTSPSVTIANGQTGVVSWVVTSDIFSGAFFGWVIMKTNDTANGEVQFHSKEGAAALGNPALGPRLVLEYGP